LLVCLSNEILTKEFEKNNGSSEVTRKNGEWSDMERLLTFTQAVEHTACGKMDVRRWRWIGKGREGGDTVMRVRIRRLGELAWVVAEAWALEWKGRRAWGYVSEYAG